MHGFRLNGFFPRENTFSKIWLQNTAWNVERSRSRNSSSPFSRLRKLASPPVHPRFPLHFSLSFPSLFSMNTGNAKSYDEAYALYRAIFLSGIGFRIAEKNARSPLSVYAEEAPDGNTAQWVSVRKQLNGESEGVSRFRETTKKMTTKNPRDLLAEKWKL